MQDNTKKHNNHNIKAVQDYHIAQLKSNVIYKTKAVIKNVTTRDQVVPI